LPDLTFAGDDKSPETAADFDSHDTVGAVALDSFGNLAAATSTGGTLNKTPGRVGDSSLIGCGCYADNASAAVSLTGWGEPIMKLVLGKWAVDKVQWGVLLNRWLPKRWRIYSNGSVAWGMILLGPDGRYGLAHNTRGCVGVWNEEGMRTGFVVKDEE